MGNYHQKRVMVNYHDFFGNVEQVILVDGQQVRRAWISDKA